ncbi:MAG: DUF3536 domain-containing protein [Elusimicrobiota bacterium]
MDDQNKTNRYLAIHAHFYQPLRYDPFTGEIELDATSKPYDNWNHRIAMECYFPNLFARIFDKNGEILEIVNNYEYLNFNFGPTLLNWIEIYYPKYYDLLIKTVIKIKSEKGISPAIAQAYNHTILPLDNFFNKITQIQWGIRDFESRFNFKPQGMWIAEMAVNEDVLRILIDHNIKYIILSPSQISKAINIKTQKEEKIVPNKLYVWFDRDEKGRKLCSRHINIFLYDEELSRKVAFDNLTFNSEIFVREIDERFKTTQTDLILIATDGETFGHHHKFADLTLAHAFRYELPKHNIKTISLSQYLKEKDPESEVELSKGPDGDGTSWSCAHGIRRWKGGCNCGDEGRYDTSWRFGLRSAIKWLSEVLCDIYIEAGKDTFKNPSQAINDYIYLINKKVSLKDFLSENLKEQTKNNTEKASKILLMIKYQMLANTSCGWFFNDISRIETMQNLKYALKAISIAEDLGYRGIEKGFLSLLEMSKSNFSQFIDGKNIYENYIKPHKLRKEIIYSYLAIKLAFTEKNYYHNFIYNLKLIEKKKAGEDTYFIYVIITDNEYEVENNYEIQFDFSNLSEIKIKLLSDEQNGFQEINFKEFTHKMQLEIFKLIITLKKEKSIEELTKTLATVYEIVMLNREIATENMEEDIKYISNQIINIYLLNFLKTQEISFIKKIDYVIETLKNIGFNSNYKLTNDILSLMPDFINLISTMKSNDLSFLKQVFRKLELYVFIFHIENIENLTSLETIK